VFSTVSRVPFGVLSAKDLASFAVLIIAESIVNVLPKPISSARIPPPVSLGVSFFSKPVIECIYLNRVSYLRGKRSVSNAQILTFLFPKTILWRNRSILALKDEI
jgi:hypothetical protein